jgi:DNA-binding FadR family transcriptional regulator
LDFALTLPPDGSRGTRLLEALREAIFSGRLGLGERLPPSRALAAQLTSQHLRACRPW